MFSVDFLLGRPMAQQLTGGCHQGFHHRDLQEIYAQRLEESDSHGGHDPACAGVIGRASEVKDRHKVTGNAS